MRRTASCCLLAIFACVASSAVEVQQTEKTITLRNEHCELTLDVSKGCAPLTTLQLAGDDDPVATRAVTTLYFQDPNHWVDEAWIKASEVAIADVPGGKSLQVDVDDFGGFRFRKTVTMRDDSPVVQVSCRLQAPSQVKPHLICPVGLSCPPALDQLISSGGTVGRSDIKVSDFALKLNAAWYAFGSSEAGKGVALAPVAWPDMYKVNWIGHKPGDTLHLFTRLHPMRTFEPGDEVGFSYNIAPFSGDAQKVAEQALAAGPGPIDPLPPIQNPPATDRAAEPAQGLRVAYCSEIRQAPQIDGKLDEPCWDSAGTLEQWLKIDGKSFPEAGTVARVGYDAENLYVALRCTEPMMDSVRADAKPGSGTVWTDDCVELFIDCNPDDKSYAHLIVNAAGVRQDNLPGERGVQFEWTAAVQKEENAWTVEVRVPFADLDAEAPKPADTWRVNACRSRLPKREATCWSPTFKGFHVPERFGILAFGDPPVRVAKVETGLDGQAEERVFTVRLQNDTDTPQTVTGELNAGRTGEPPSSAPISATIPAQSEGTLEARYETDAGGAYRLAATISAGEPIFRAAFQAQVYSAGLCSALYPAEEDENRLYVAKGTVQHFFFVPANHSEKKYDEFSFVLTAPQGFDVIQASGDMVTAYYRPTLAAKETVERDGRPMTRWVWKSGRSLGPIQIDKRRFFNAWCGALIPAPDLPEGSYPLYFGLESGEEREEEQQAELIVLPEPKGSRPQEIVIGMSGWTLSPTMEFWRGLIDTYRKCGLNLVDSHVQGHGDEWYAPLKQAGMRSFKLMWWFWWNDEYLKAHPEHAAIKFDGKPDEKMICPEIIASPDTDAIAGVMRPIVEQAKAGRIEGTWWDLEGPACFRVCFCPRCLKAFREQAGIPADEELTPLKIQTKYDAQWVRFACGQSDRIAARMRAYAQDAGVDWRLAVYSGGQSEHTRRSYRVDWETLTPHIDVATPSFYSFSPTALSSNFTRGIGDIVGLVKGIKDIPVWATLSTGYGRHDNFTPDGRLTRMQIIKSIAYGADGTCQWWWGPVDGRHYTAYAEATALIAKLEPFFTQGTMAPHLLSGDIPGGTTRIAWTLGDELLVMLFNDGTQSPATIQARLPAGYTRVRDDGRGTLSVEGNAISASVPPLDCRWVVLRRDAG